MDIEDIENRDLYHGERKEGKQLSTYYGDILNTFPSDPSDMINMYLSGWAMIGIGRR